MKYVIFWLLIFLSLGITAQTTYNSPYVNNGKSFSIQIPSPFTNIGDLDNTTTVFSRDHEFNLNGDDMPEDDIVFIGLYPRIESETGMIDELVANLTQDKEQVKSLELPETVLAGGYTVRQVGFNGYFEGEYFEGMYIATVDFDQVTCSILYFQPKSGSKNSLDAFNQIVASFSETITDRVNAFDPYEYDFEDEFYSNSLFESQFTYEDIFFDGEEMEEFAYWEEDYEYVYPELMIAYTCYTQSEMDAQRVGGIKVFSGGKQSAFEGNASKVAALQEVFPDYDITNIAQTGSVSGSEFTFVKYSVQSSVTTPKAIFLYTTVHEDELFFFLVYRESTSTSYFDGSYEEFIKTLWFWDESMIGE